MALTAVAKRLLLVIAARHVAGLSLRGDGTDHEVAPHGLDSPHGLDPSQTPLDPPVGLQHRLTGNSSSALVADAASKHVEPAMKIKGDLVMAAALLGTPFVLYLLR